MAMYDPESVAARSGTADSRSSYREPIEISSITEMDDIVTKEELKKQFEHEKSNLMGEINDLKKKISKAEEERKTLMEQIKKLTETNVTLEAKVEKLTETNITLEAKVESQGLEIEKLTEMNISRGLENDELKQEISKLQKELKSKDYDIESLKAQITNLKEEQRRVQGDQDTLYISQVGYQFEQAICSYILPEVFENDQFATIKSLLKYLHGKSRLPVADRSGKLLLEAKERWDKVCVHLNLPAIREGDGSFTQWGHDESSTPDVIKALSLLKKKRRTIAHPRPISLKLAGKKLPAVKDKMPLWHFKLIEHFIATIQKSIERSGSKIYSEHFELD